MVGGMVTAPHNLVGLARVSTVVQDAQLQRDALTAAGCGRRGRLGSLVGPRQGMVWASPDAPGSARGLAQSMLCSTKCSVETAWRSDAPA